MWKLVRLGDCSKLVSLCIYFTGWSVVLKSPQSLIVGRVDSDILISDKSISRKHAKLEVTKQGNDLCFILTDYSRFGSFVNGAALAGGSCQLKHDDVVKFGAQPGVEFRLICEPFKVALSSMSKELRQRMKAVISLLHGEVINELDMTCRFLIMTSVVVTTKVVCALLAQVPIVTPAFMEKYLEASSHIPFHYPDPKEYQPAVKEIRFTSDDSYRFEPDQRRRTLFSDKVFYTLSCGQYAQLENMAVLGGGKIWLLDGFESAKKIYQQRFHAAPSVPNTEAVRMLLAEPSACLVHARPSREFREWQRTLYCVLRAIHRRPILESELGFATIFVSTMAYCNPDRKCPDKLYREASISQAFSINPFHMDSQPDEGVLKEKQDNGHSPHQPTKKLSLQRICLGNGHAEICSLICGLECKGHKKEEMQSESVSYGPAVPGKSEELRSIIVGSKKPVHNLVPDSEALCVTPSHFVPVFSNDRANQTPSQSNSFTSPSCTADSVRLMKDELVTRDLKPQPNLALSLNYHVRSSPATEDDLLGALDSMPSLVTIVAPKLSILTENGTDCQANSSVSREALTTLASADRLLSPLEARQPIVHHVAASGIQIEPVWPVHMQRGELVAPENRGKSRFIVNLAAYASQVDEPESSVRVSLQVADDEERERINRMFEKIGGMHK
ncbi:hypothetical protein D915_006670 [Fasciola hepatica]|uniref:FHA domain-containing protein n=1 Tax=Fasciola hepatica TaxID=6192 RepID=A0A4E0RWS2_FASHE|nr:hypothetical protein D915_006670 [Fasciola hepatica]